jgi:hypothetical protein
MNMFRQDQEHRPASPRTKERHRGTRQRKKIPTIQSIPPFHYWIILVVISSGCSGGANETSPVIETLADGTVDVIHSFLPDRTVGLDTIAVWDLERDDADYLFNSIQDVAGCPGGFFLLDGGNREVVRLTIDGSVIFRFGRRGQGPGEFQLPAALRVSKDHIWVADARNRRYSVFRLDGTYERDVRWTGIGHSDREFLPLGEDLLLFGARTFLSLSQAERIEPNFYLCLEELPTGVADTLVVMLGLRWHRITLTADTGEQELQVEPPQFAPEFRWDSTEEGRVFTVTGDSYQIEERDLTGSIRRRIKTPTLDLTVSRRDKEWFFDGFRFTSADGRVLRATRTSLEDYPFAERRQAITGLAVDPLGRLWVRASTENPGRPRIDLFSLDGEFLGRLATTVLPLAFTDGGAALLRTTAGDGVERYLVVRPLLP